VMALGQAASGGGCSQLLLGLGRSGALYAYAPALLRAVARVGRLGEWGVGLRH
jgi:hypothetical protein